MARQSSSQVADSYYTVIKGKKYDRRMLELADGLTQGRGDGRISINDAKTLLRVVKDSNNYSAIEKQTMEYIRKKYKFTKEGDQFFRDEIRKWAATKSKKRSTPKSAKPKAAAQNAPAPAAEAPAPAATPEYPAPRAAAASSSSPWKEILLGLLLLLVLSAAFYFIAYKSGCTKSAPVKEETTAAAASTQQVVPAAPQAEASTSTPAAKVTAAQEVPADLRELVENTRLIFVAEKTELLPTTAKKIDALAARLKNEDLKLLVTGHTCSLGPKQLNQEISEKRAQVVKDALVARGVPATNIETRGIADAETIGDQKTVAGRVASRRVTFKVLQ